MSALSIQPTYPTFADVNGQPLDNGYIWLGTANLDPQTNPIAVYWDAALTMPAAQPIRTLAGYPSNNGTPARLYVNSDYSIRVMNKNGSVVYSAPAATERYSDVVVSGVNAEDVIYDPPFLGGVQTNVEEKLAQTVSVKDFGAVGDGVTDDTAAIQAALTASSNVVIPSGNYVVNGTITLSTGKSLILNSATLTKKSSAANTDPVVNITGSNAVLQGIGSSFIVSEKNSPKGVVGIYDPAYVNSIFYSKVLNLSIQGNSDASSNVIYAETGKQQGGAGVTYFTTLDNLVLSYAANGIYLTAECNAFLISNITFAHLSVAAFNFVGTAAADANVYANAINNVWFTNAVGASTTMVRLRYATQNSFTNCMAEQGGASAKLADCDATALSNVFQGTSNVAGGSVVVNGTRNFFQVNGSWNTDIGTWTPTIVGNTTAGSNTYYIQNGTYMRMGRLVYIQFRVQINVKDPAMAGGVLIGDLPFSALALTGSVEGEPSMAISGYRNLTLPAGFTQVGALVARGSQVMRIYRMGSGVAGAPVDTAEIANSFEIYGSGIYVTQNLY